MTRKSTIPSLHDRCPTSEELARDKRISDRAALLHHIDYIIRPPAWVYEEIEEAIGYAIEGNLAAEIRSRDGRSYIVADLLECWEVEEDLLEIYAQPADHPNYRVAGGRL